MTDAAGSPSLQSPPPSATFPSLINPPENDVQNTKPRTVGGFVLEDDEAEEEGSRPNGNMSGPNNPQNVFRGSSTTPQQYPLIAQSPSSRPQSAMTFPSMSNNFQEQSPSDNAPLRTSEAAVVSHGSGDALISPTVPSHLRASAQNAPLNASHESRPSTANGAVNSSTAVVTSARLPHDRVGMLEDRIAEDPKGDTEAWFALVDEHKRRNKMTEVRNTYERFLALFPTAAEQWIAYANWELDNNRLFQAEQIFTKSIKNVLNVALWNTYLNYVRRRYPLIGADAEKNRKVISDVFDFVLKEVGLDKDAGRLWQEYIEFLKSMPGAVGGASWQDQQKMDLLRKAFHKAVSIPTDAVETLWRDYDVFEMGLNKMTARKFLQERSEDYMTARSSKTELQNLSKGLNRSTLPLLPPALGFEGDDEYLNQVDMWKKWIAWEKGDPLVLKSDRPDELQARVLYVYKQATMSLRFWPDIWFEAAEWCFGNGLNAEGDKFLDHGFEANPESCLLAFKKADRVESSPSSDEGDESIKRRGDAVRAPYDRVLDALYGLIKKTGERENRAIAQLREDFAQQTSKSPLGHQLAEDDEDPEGENDTHSQSQLQSQIEAVSGGIKAQIELYRKLITSIWISLMRAMRRVQGKGKPGDLIGGFRQVFADARKRGKVNSEVYTASALIEHHCYKDPAATKIFDRGFKLFPEDESFATEYIKHLIAINDVTNARAVFETAVNKLTQREETKHKAKPIFALFHRHEALYGDLDQVKKLEKRISTLFPEDPTLSLFSERHTTQGFNPCAIRPVISPGTQTKPKASDSHGLGGLRQTAFMRNSPPPPLATIGSITNSPKRSLDESDNEMPPRKMQRGDSPLKGAAGRRLDAARKTGLRNEVNQGTSTPQPAPAPPTLPPAVMQLLQIIPSAQTYAATRFDPQKMVELLRDVDYSKADISLMERNPSQTQHVPQPHLPVPPYYSNSSFYGYTR